MGSTDQANPSCFYFRITWILMEWWKIFFFPSACCRASEASNIDCFKVWKFTKFYLCGIIITLILMIKKRPPIFSKLKKLKWLWPTLYFYFWGPATSGGDKKIKARWFHQYSWSSEVETTWISLIGWPP